MLHDLDATDLHPRLGDGDDAAAGNDDVSDADGIRRQHLGVAQDSHVLLPALKVS